MPGYRTVVGKPVVVHTGPPSGCASLVQGMPWVHHRGATTVLAWWATCHREPTGLLAKRGAQSQYDGSAVTTVDVTTVDVNTRGCHTRGCHHRVSDQ